MTTRVFIIPTDLRDDGNAMAEALGWGGPVFVQPLSPTGSEPITHWGFPAIVGPEFLALWENPPPEAAAICSVIAVDTREGGDTVAHWYDFIASLGLVTVPADEATQTWAAEDGI